MRKNHIMSDDEFEAFMDGERVEDVMLKTAKPVVLDLGPDELGTGRVVPCPTHYWDNPTRKGVQG